LDVIDPDAPTLPGTQATCKGNAFPAGRSHERANSSVAKSCVFW